MIGIEKQAIFVFFVLFHDLSLFMIFFMAKYGSGKLKKIWVGIIFRNPNC